MRGIRSNPRAKFYVRKDDELIHGQHTCGTLKPSFFRSHFSWFLFSDMEKGRNEVLKQDPKGTTWLWRLYGTVDVSKYAFLLDTTIKHYHKFPRISEVLECWNAVELPINSAKFLFCEIFSFPFWWQLKFSRKRDAWNSGNFQFLILFISIYHYSRVVMENEFFV